MTLVIPLPEEDRHRKVRSDGEEAAGGVLAGLRPRWQW